MSLAACIAELAVPPLPIVIEQTWATYVFPGPIGILLLGCLVVAVRKVYAQKERPLGLSIRLGVALLVIGALALELLLQPVGWRFRLGEDAVSLRAPFDPFTYAGTIAWRDLANMDFVVKGSRTRYLALRLRDIDGRSVELDALDVLPKSFASVFVAVVDDRAPQLRTLMNLAEFARHLEQHLGESYAGGIATRRFRIRDGSGRELK